MQKIIFFDIETVSGVKFYDDLSQNMQNLWAKKAERYISDDMDATQVYTQKAGIFAEFGKIVCISCGWYDQNNEFITKSFAGDDEKRIVSDFMNFLSKYPMYVLCGHNIKEFDMPYVCRRAMVHGVGLAPQLQLRGKKPRDINHIDTMEMWKFGDYKAYTSLALLCELFGIETPKDDIDGSQVSRVYREEGDIDRIIQYCEKDVVATAKVWERLVRKS